MIFEVNKNPSQKELRQFGAVVWVGFFFIGAIIFFAPFLRSRDILTLGGPLNNAKIVALSLQVLGLVVWGLTYVSPMLARPVYVAWMTGGMIMGTIMSGILLTILFLFLLPVFSIIVRRSDPLRKRLEPDSDTYWEDYKPYEPTLERMQRLF